jgi:hypothetical protein
MTEAPHSLHLRHVLVLARWRALQCVRQRYRDAGRKFTSIKMHEQHADAQAYLARHPELIDWDRAL